MSRVQSIERAFAVLEVLADGPAGVTEVAERTDLPKSTVARLLAALATEGAVEHVAGGTDYRVGDRLVTLAAGVRPTRGLVALARPHLARLAEVIGETAGLSIPDGFLVHYVDQEDGQHPVGIRDWTGTRLPMHAVSSGLVFLAHLPSGTLERFLASPLERFTDATVIDPGLVRERVRRVRLDGYAWTCDEVADGISSVAAAVAGGDGEVVAAIHVHGPSYRFPGGDGTAREDDARRRISDAVVEAAARVSGSLRQAG